jgi:hypothetical protein
MLASPKAEENLRKATLGLACATAKKGWNSLRFENRTTMRRYRRGLTACQSKRSQLSIPSRRQASRQMLLHALIQAITQHLGIYQFRVFVEPAFPHGYMQQHWRDDERPWALQNPPGSELVHLLAQAGYRKRLVKFLYGVQNRTLDNFAIVSLPGNPSEQCERTHNQQPLLTFCRVTL